MFRGASAVQARESVRQIAAMFFAAASTFVAHGQSCHLWYNDSGVPGDMLVNSVMVDATAPATYYETHGWNFGSGKVGAGYAGIQDTGNGHNFIVSVWDFSSTLLVDHAAWVPPGGTFGQRFCCEGDGFQIINPAKSGDIWHLNGWYTIVVRSIPSGSGSIVAAWLHDVSSGAWTLQGVHATPAPLHFDDSAIAFLENYSGHAVAAHRRMYTRDGWKRTLAGDWQAFTKAWYDGPNPEGNGGAMIRAFFMEMGSEVTNTAGSGAVFSGVPALRPSWPPGGVIAARAAADPGLASVHVEWTIDPNVAPPIGYEVEMSADPAFSPASTVRKSAMQPWVRSADFAASSLPATLVHGRVRITDLLDRTSPWFEFTAINDTVNRSFAWASSLNWSSVVNGWGPAERDRSNGETGATDGRTITLNGTTYAHGIGCHALSRITIALDRKYDWFLSDVGVDDEMAGTSGSIVFRVYVDGQLRHDSGLINGSTSTQQVMVDLMGAASMTLEVTDGGDGWYYDHADWADARLVKLAGGCAAKPGLDCDANGVLDACQIGRISTDLDRDGQPDACQYASGDFDLSHFIDMGDVAFALLEFGAPGPTDLDRDGMTDFGDIAILLMSFGPA